MERKIKIKRINQDLLRKTKEKVILKLFAIESSTINIFKTVLFNKAHFIILYIIDA